MLAGYLSASTFRALKPKKRFADLSWNECCKFDGYIYEELRRLFEDEAVIECIGGLELMQNYVENGIDNIIGLLYESEYSADKTAIEAINHIGVKRFLLDYIYCTDDALANMDEVNAINIAGIFLVRDTFKKLLQLNGLVENVPSKSSESINSYNLIEENENNQNEALSVEEEEVEYKSGKGFSASDVFKIDADAIAPRNKRYTRCVHYLYSLDAPQFELFADYLFDVTSDCSVRLWNAIRRLGIRKFYVNYLFADAQKILRIPSFGRKSLQELEEVKEFVHDFVVSEYNKNHQKQISSEEVEEQTEIPENRTLIEAIGPIYYTLVEEQLKQLMADASARVQNSINNYEGNFLEDFVFHRKDIRSLHHIGKKTEKEFVQIISVLRSSIQRYQESTVDPEELEWLAKVSFYGESLDDYSKEFFMSNGHLPMLHVLHNCITRLINEDRNYAALNSVVPLLENGEGDSLESVAANFNLSRERIRQLCNSAIEDITTTAAENEKDAHSKFQKLFLHQEDWAYVINALRERLYWESEDLVSMVVGEGCTLASSLLMNVLTTHFADTFGLVGKNSLSVNSRKGDWFGSYLVKREFTDGFDFEKMKDLLHSHEECHTESVTLSMQELLLDTFYEAWIQFDPLMTEEMKPLMETIFVNEFGKIPDIDFNFTLEGKKEELPEDVLYDILKIENHPMTLESLYEEYSRRYPNKYSSPNSLRAIVNRAPRLLFVGLNSLVTLSEWDHVQVGSIRELIVGYLADFEEPQHIKDIVAYIQTLRDTNEHSINTTMINGSQFRNFPGGYFGLADKTYPEWFSLTESERNSRKRIVELEEFLKENLHFPFCPSENREEELLNQWWGRLKRQKDISDFLRERIGAIEQTYYDLPHTKSDKIWMDNCTIYKEFVHSTGRKPSENRTGEAELARWFSKTLNDLYDGKLSSMRESSFIKLCQSL